MSEKIAVSALNRYVHSLLEENSFLNDIVIVGEINNFTRNYKSGHCYFSLKDNKASVRAVMFRSNADRLAFQPEDGMKVLVHCQVTLYERDGTFQLYVDDIFPDGVGAAQLAFEQLKARLASEGLFSPDTKKMLPEFPTCVGLVTSKTGAALQDILKVAERRCPDAHFLLAPVSVQGRDAEKPIVKAIQKLDAIPIVDVIIIARGGGSAEDLWVFNSELIARAVYACSKPVVSAIGHEIDFTILDFVADVRAPTPSAAAEIVLPNMADSWRNMMQLFTNITNNMHAQMDLCYNKLNILAHHAALVRVPELPVQRAERLIALAKGIQQRVYRSLVDAQMQMKSVGALAESLNPYGVLSRGYGVVRKDGNILRSVDNAKIDEQIAVTLLDGELVCRVEEIIPKQEKR